MLIKVNLKLILSASLIYFAGCEFLNGQKKNNSASFKEIALKESAIPVRPGKPGENPFWNTNARQFIFAPAFDYKKVEKAVKYNYSILSLEDSSTFSFENKVQYAPLSKVWTSVPTGWFTLKVTGLSAKGITLGVAGEGRYYRAAPFGGVYHQPVLPYDSSAMLALDHLMDKEYVKYWFKHKSPDPSYINYRYPAKIFSALIIGAITHARLRFNSPEAKKSAELAEIVADYLLQISFKEGTPWEFFPPTYYGPHAENAQKQHLKPINNFTIMGVDAGNAYLDLYDFGGNRKYLEAAKRIASTYLKNQLENGTWFQFVNHQTGKPTAENLVIPTSVINYFNRLKNDYQVKGLERSTRKAYNWIMHNPVKTFNWQGQFEDVEARRPYANLSREQACDFAVYLFKNKKKGKLAEELVRFSEDQFVIWEKPLDISFKDKSVGGQSVNWITPSVQEQYVFWMPVGRAAGIMIETFWEAYSFTKKEIYLAKAISIANAFTLVQQENHGDYPTFFTRFPMNQWLNSTVYPARIMMNFNENKKKSIPSL